MLDNLQSQPHKQFSKFTKKRSWVHFLVIPVLSLVMTVSSPFFELKTHNSETASAQSLAVINENKETVQPLYLAIQKNSLMSTSEPNSPENQVNYSFKVTVTAYSSTVCQTDDTPFITASGTSVRNGIVAANFLPFGAKIRIPDIYGERIFVVEDRMHPRKTDQIDIWFESYWQAKQFGIKMAYIEILE